MIIGKCNVYYEYCKKKTLILIVNNLGFRLHLLYYFLLSIFQFNHKKCYIITIHIINSIITNENLIVYFYRSLFLLLYYLRNQFRLNMFIYCLFIDTRYFHRYSPSQSTTYSMWRDQVNNLKTINHLLEKKTSCLVMEWLVLLEVLLRMVSTTQVVLHPTFRFS